MNAEDGRGLDLELRALEVYDVGASAADRTRAACLAALSRGRRPAGTSAGRRTGATSGPLAWTEPLAAVGISAIYLAAAIQASMVLIGR